MKKLTLVLSLAAFAMVSQLCFAVNVPPPVPEEGPGKGPKPAGND